MSQPIEPSDTTVPAGHTVPPDRDLPASTAVFGIAELLNLILRQVPVEHLTALRPVARLWKLTISELNHIDPISIGHGEKDCKCLGDDTCARTPHYTSRFAIRGNPIFRYTHVYRGVTKDSDNDNNAPKEAAKTIRHYRGITLKSRYDSSELAGSANHFITDPPVTMVSLSNSEIPDLEMEATLQVPTGIRVYDVHDVLTNMCDVSGGDDCLGIAKPTAWYGSASHVVEGTDDPGVGAEDCDSEDDISARLFGLLFGS